MSAFIPLKWQFGKLFLVNHGAEDCHQLWAGLGFQAGELPGVPGCDYRQRGKTGKFIWTRRIGLED